MTEPAFPNSLTKAPTNQPIRLKHSRRQTYISNPAAIVEFDGPKTFYKTNTKVDILIAHHEVFLCYEVIVYNSQLDLEAPRIYINSMLLQSYVQDRLDSEQMITKLQELKEQALRQKKNFVLEEARNEQMKNHYMQYILNRLKIDETVAGETEISPQFRMVMNPINESEEAMNEDTGLLDIVYPCKPAGLVPLVSSFQKAAK
jgi:hypothetical protein